eukprot:Opistho-1_new@17926
MKFTKKHTIENIYCYRLDYHHHHIAWLNKGGILQIDELVIGKSEEGFFFYEGKFYYYKDSHTLEYNFEDKSITSYDILISNEFLQANTFIHLESFSKLDNGYYASELSLYQLTPLKKKKKKKKKKSTLR